MKSALLVAGAVFPPAVPPSALPLSGPCLTPFMLAQCPRASTAVLCLSLQLQSYPKMQPPPFSLTHQIWPVLGVLGSSSHALLQIKLRPSYSKPSSLSVTPNKNTDLQKPEKRQGFIGENSRWKGKAKSCLGPTRDSLGRSRCCCGGY